jgi:hypothetical protein
MNKELYERVRLDMTKYDKELNIFFIPVTKIMTDVMVEHVNNHIKELEKEIRKEKENE